MRYLYATLIIIAAVAVTTVNGWLIGLVVPEPLSLLISVTQGLVIGAWAGTIACRVALAE